MAPPRPFRAGLAPPAAVLLVASAALSAQTTLVVAARGRAEREQACQVRGESRSEIRQAIVTGVDEVAGYAELDPFRAPAGRADRRVTVPASALDNGRASFDTTNSVR